MSKRSIVYIDGFNLYYGALKGSKCKWLNLEEYFRLLRQDDRVEKIKYFTAKVKGTKGKDQEIYLNALRTCPKVQITLGTYKLKDIKCRVKSCTFTDTKTFKIPEEKKTDVSIAVSMTDDAFNQRCERMVLVSGDTDLVPALQLIKRCHPSIEIIIYIPSTDEKRGAARELREIADKDRTLPLKLLGKAQFDEKLKGPDGLIQKPSDW